MPIRVSGSNLQLCSTRDVSGSLQCLACSDQRTQRRVPEKGCHLRSIVDRRESTLFLPVQEVGCFLCAMRFGPLLLELDILNWNLELEFRAGSKPVW